MVLSTGGLSSDFLWLLSYQLTEGAKAELGHELGDCCSKQGGSSGRLLALVMGTSAQIFVVVLQVELGTATWL